MKKRWLLLPIFILILVFTFLPSSFISANPGNLVKNGDFSDGSNNWSTSGGSVVFGGGTVLIGPGVNEWIMQPVDTTRKDLKLSFDVNPVDYGSAGDSLSPGLYAGFDLSNGGYLGDAYYYYGNGSFPLGEWTRGVSFYVSDAWFDTHGTDLPDFNEIGVWLAILGDAIAYFDNVKLTYPEDGATESVWVRTMPMTCYRVWINDDGNFQFIFWYPYADNNWIKIYDMEGNMVYETDMPWDNPNLIVDLPDGMYTVKTFHCSDEPIQEFVIGKP